MPVRRIIDALKGHPILYRIGVDLTAVAIAAALLLSAFAFRDTRRLSDERVQTSREISRELCREINRINLRDRLILTRAGATALLDLVEPPRDCTSITIPD